MSTNFPTSLDNFTNPSPTDPRNSPSHASQHADANDAIEALEAKVGIDGSAVTTSHDYKLSGVTGTAKAVATDDARLTDARTPLAHNHAASEITSGTLDIARIPTGTTSTTVCIGNDARLSDSRTPTAHASSHQDGGSDEIATATPTANAIPKAGSGGRLDKDWLPVASQGVLGAVEQTGLAGSVVSASYIEAVMAANGSLMAWDGNGNAKDTGYTVASFQPVDATLTALAGLTTAADRGIYFTGTDTASVFVLTSAGRALLDDADAAAQRTTLGLGSLAVLSTVGTPQIDNDAVTYAKIQNVSATDKVLGRSSVGAGDVEEIACTAAGRALIDDADAAAQRTTLGLGSLATLSTVGTSQIDNDAVTDAKLRNGTACTVIGRSANSTGDVADIAASTNGTFLGRRSDALGFYSPKFSELTASGAWCTFSGAQSIANLTWAAINFSSENYDTDNYHDNSTNNSRFTAPADGKYLVTGKVNKAANANTTYTQIAIRVDGTSYRAQQNCPPNASYGEQGSLSLILSLTNGQYVELCIFHATTGGASVNATAAEFSIQYMGA